MNIIEILQQLKDLTLDIIKEVNNDNDVNEMLKRREQLVSDLIACEVDKIPYENKCVRNKFN